MSNRKISLFMGFGCLLLLLFFFEMFSVVTQAPWVYHFDMFWMQHTRIYMTPLWTSALAFLTHLGSFKFVILMTIIIVAMLLYKRRFAFGIWFLGTIAVCGVLIKILKEYIKRPRPDVDGWLIEASGFSYPSGHSAGSSIFYFLIALFLIVLFQRLTLRCIVGILCFLWVLFIMYSRVYLGVHFPSDVLGGFLFGSSLAFLSMGFYFLFFKKI